MYVYQVLCSVTFYHGVTGHSYSYRYVNQVTVLAEVYVTIKQFRGTCTVTFAYKKLSSGRNAAYFIQLPLNNF
jgi:hypothetical protein